MILKQFANVYDKQRIYPQVHLCSSQWDLINLPNLFGFFSAFAGADANVRVPIGSSWDPLTSLIFWSSLVILKLMFSLANGAYITQSDI